MMIAGVMSLPNPLRKREIGDGKVLLDQ